MLSRPEQVKPTPELHTDIPGLSNGAAVAEAIVDEAAIELMAMIEAEPVPEQIRKLALDLTRALARATK